MAAAGGDSELEIPLCPGAPRVVFQHPARAAGLLAAAAGLPDANSPMKRSGRGLTLGPRFQLFGSMTREPNLSAS